MINVLRHIVLGRVGLVQSVTLCLLHSCSPADGEPQLPTSQSQPSRGHQQQVRDDWPQSASSGVVGDPEGRGPAERSTSNESGAETTSKKIRTVVYDDNTDEESNKAASTVSTRRDYKAVYTSPPAESPEVGSFTHSFMTLLIRYDSTCALVPAEE